jgi:hypothetical protein
MRASSGTQTHDPRIREVQDTRSLVRAATGIALLKALKLELPASL